MPKNELIFDNFIYFSPQCDNQPLGYGNWSLSTLQTTTQFLKGRVYKSYVFKLFVLNRLLIMIKHYLFSTKTIGKFVEVFVC
jgi:hypothetical protein